MARTALAYCAASFAGLWQLREHGFSNPSIFLIILCLGFAICTAIVFNRVFLSPLAAFPGPWLAAATYGYEFYFDIWPYTFRYMWKIKALHDKYGPIVRINPTHLHILDPSFYEEIHPSDTRRK